MKMRVFLIGGFDESRYLARSLIKKGYQVTAINENESECEELALIGKLNVFNGDGSKPYVLEDANAYDADIAIAMTEYDDANLVICELCKKRFNVKKTVALISDPKNTDFFHQMGVDQVVCAITTISSIIEQTALMNSIGTVMPIDEGEIQIAQVVIPKGAASLGKKLWEIDLPEGVIIGCILRGSHSMVPKGDTRILEGDNLILIASDNDKDEAIRVLTDK